MKIKELSFPVTTEAFMDFQCELNGKPLDKSWVLVIDALVPELNAAYKCPDLGALEATLKHIGVGISKFESDPVLLQALKSTRYWLAYAWDRGRCDAESKVAV